MQKITKTKFSQWSDTYVMDALRGVPYGRSFCNHFGIKDYILYFTANKQFCDKHIRKHYVR